MTAYEIPVISQFADSNRFLSNFYMYPFELPYLDPPNLTLCKSVEHYYQSAKTLDLAVKLEILNANTPSDAKRLGNKLNTENLLRPDWREINKCIMMKGLLYKFSIPQLAELLLRTNNSILVEGNYWKDTFWGYDFKLGYGKNLLGQYLMLIRSRLQRNKYIDLRALIDDTKFINMIR